MNRSSTATKRAGASSCGRWPTCLEDLEPAAGNRRVRVFAVSDRDDRIACAPDDEDGHAFGRGRGGRRRGRVARRCRRHRVAWRGTPCDGRGRQATRSRVRPRRRRRSAAGRRTPGRARPWLRRLLPSAAVAADEQVRARQRRGSQDRAHLGTEPAAGNEHQALGASRGTGRRTASRCHRRASARRASRARGRARPADRAARRPAPRVSSHRRRAPSRRVRAGPAASTVCVRASGSITSCQFSSVAGHPVDQQQHRAADPPARSSAAGRGA